MEYSKLGLEHFTPDYTRYFHGLAEPVRDRLVAAQWQLHKGIDADTTAAIHDELYRRTLDGGWPDTTLTPGVHVRTAGRIAATQVELHLEHEQQKTRSRLTTDAVVLATGHRERPLGRLLAGLDPYMRRDSSERPRVDDRHRLVLDPSVTGSVYVQNAETHTHGVGTPDLGLAAWRSATILNDLTGRSRTRRPPAPPSPPSAWTAACPRSPRRATTGRSPPWWTGSRAASGTAQNTGTPSRVSDQSADAKSFGSSTPFAVAHSAIRVRISVDSDHSSLADATCGKAPPPLAR